MDAAQKKALAEAHKNGLTYEKIASDRMAAFEVGTEHYIEKVGMDEQTADQFRGIMKQGLDELSANPEAVQKILQESGASAN